MLLGIYLLRHDVEEIVVLPRFNLRTLTHYSLCQILKASIDQGLMKNSRLIDE